MKKTSQKSHTNHKLLRGNRRRTNALEPCMPTYSFGAVRDRPS